MRVAIDARKLHDFGIGTYIRNLLRHLARIDRETEYVLLCADSDLDVPRQLGDNFRAVRESSPNYSLREQIHIPYVLLREKPERVLEKAVRGMLPKTKLGDALFGKLKVYAGPTHPHAAQRPVPGAAPS